MYIKVNGTIIPEEEARISPLDHGFLYGMGLFETFRTYDGHPFLLDEHMKRLREGADEMNIQLPAYDRQDVVETIRALLAANKNRDLYFRWNVTAGHGGVGLTAEPYEEPGELVFVKDAPTPPATKQARVLTQTRNTPEGAVRRKSHHYMNSMLAKQELGQDPGTEGMMLTSDGHVSEGIVSNVFWVKKDTLYTPSLETGCLPGVTRAWVADYADKQRLPFQEGFFTAADMMQAEAVFVTNAIQEIVPVTAIDGRPFDSQTNPHLLALKQQYEIDKKQAYSLGECGL
ncbi:aminodeoxychorismate lyase [Salisediminibacterium selenitireducens]|uniref:Aminotransferase class IV n=1 Tax=Bacillus selenitireducens (strain ATCC 700615 / DSM 15326 / MLS10) TaxID=439292 RepID=D6XV64_BACIE|nr:aminodeoxychorismate lyase [Salisediminibacterium selenitireducens]ADH97622.1 aminotransferase class IV [[Bacillus] selenitireducens MLS10]